MPRVVREGTRERQKKEEVMPRTRERERVRERSAKVYILFGITRSLERLTGLRLAASCLCGLTSYIQQEAGG